MQASKSSSATSSQRERKFCSSLGSLVPVFEFTDARLRGGCEDKVRFEASLMWVGAQAWRRARAQGDRRRLPTPFRRKIQPTAKPPPVIVVGADNIADLEFGRLQYVCNPRCPSSTPRRSADLEFRQLQYTSEAEVSWTREARVGAQEGQSGWIPTPVNIADLGFRRLSSIQGARVGARGDLGPGVQAEAMHIQDGCRTHPGSLSYGR